MKKIAMSCVLKKASRLLLESVTKEKQPKKKDRLTGIREQYDSIDECFYLLDVLFHSTITLILSRRFPNDCFDMVISHVASGLL
jgi:hypothetical protein